MAYPGVYRDDCEEFEFAGRLDRPGLTVAVAQPWSFVNDDREVVRHNAVALVDASITIAPDGRGDHFARLIFFDTPDGILVRATSPTGFVLRKVDGRSSLNTLAELLMIHLRLNLTSTNVPMSSWSTAIKHVLAHGLELIGL